MVQDKELLKLTIELVRLICVRDDLHRKLITNSADIQDFESALFKLCLFDFSEEVEFIQSREDIIDKVTDKSQQTDVYSVVSNGVVTFYEYDGTPLIKLVMSAQEDFD